MSFLSQFVIVVIETYGEYVTWDWYKIMLDDFLDTRLVTGTISVR